MTKLAQHNVNNSITIYWLSPEALTEGNNMSGMRYCHEKQEWKHDMFPIPTFIYDRCYYPSKITPSLLEKVAKLKQRKDVIFLGYGLPNKWNVYQTLAKNSTLQSFFPMTARLSSTSYFQHYLTKHPNWLLKPIQGSQGRGLIKVEKSNGLYAIREVKQPSEQHYTFTTTAQFHQWLHNKMQTTAYIFQPFLPLQTKDGYPFDIRILLQKDERGKWKERIKVIRTGIQHHITSNLAGGGKMIAFSSFIENIPLKHRKKIEEELDTIITTLPLALEKACHPLFELGIDLGLDTKQNLWILDINSKPGHKIVTMASKTVQQEIYEAPSKYIHYLTTSLGSKIGVD